MIGPHAAAAYPDWALLNRTARLSDQRNETTAEYHGPGGKPVAASFWLPDPPAVSQFTVHCPGLDTSDTPPYVHGSRKQITVGEGAVGWVDLTCGILLGCNLFNETPVMRFALFPASRARITYKDRDPYCSPEYFSDVVCSGDLIRFVETDFTEPNRWTNGNGWRATTWNMKLDWDDWRRRRAVDADDVFCFVA
ncbi:hypothetical protein ACQ4PT_016111 [Festuca glaucescens]